MGPTHHHLDALLLHRRLVIGGVTHSDQRVDVELLQVLEDNGWRGVSKLEDGRGSASSKSSTKKKPYLGKPVERCIGWIVGDEEPHALVGNLYSGRAVHVGETA